MASTIIIYEGDGTRTDFTIPFDYLKKSFVTVRLGAGNTLTGGDYGDTGSDYYFLDKTTIRLKVAPASGESLTIRRYTSATERVVTFKDASILKATDLDTSQVQAFHIAEEGRDILEDSLSVNREGNWDAKGKRILNVGAPEADSDAVTYGVYKTDAEGAYQAKLDAEAARDAAKASEVMAKANADRVEEVTKDWATIATQQATLATTKASEAEDSATAANAEATKAKASATNAANSASTSTAQATAASNSAKAAKLSEENAALSKTATGTSEANAKASEVEAKKQADLAKGYANQAASGQINSDWAETDSTTKAFIMNKPTLGKLASKNSIAYTEVTGTPDLSVYVLGSTLTAELAKKANLSHTHTTTQITGLDTALAGKLDATGKAQTAGTADTANALASTAKVSYSQLTDTPSIPNASKLIPRGGDGGIISVYETLRPLSSGGSVGLGSPSILVVNPGTPSSPVTIGVNAGQDEKGATKLLYVFNASSITFTPITGVKLTWTNDIAPTFKTHNIVALTFLNTNFVFASLVSTWG